MTIPSEVRSAVGLTGGDLVHVKAARGKIILTPQPAIDPSKVPGSGDEYTPAQRRILDREIAKGMADVRAGRLHGPFETHEAVVAFLHAEVRKTKEKKKP